MTFEDAYTRGTAQAAAATAAAGTDNPDPRLYAPDGEPWCRFGPGLACINGDQCINPRHRTTGPATNGATSTGPASPGPPSRPGLAPTPPATPPPDKAHNP